MIENQFIYPMVVKKVVGVPSVLVILALIIGVQLFGFLGAILAIPVAAALMEYVKDVDKRQREALLCGEEEEVDLSKKKKSKIR
jgi:predicted PurR-regulated permease PerM